MTRLLILLVVFYKQMHFSINYYFNHFLTCGVCLQFLSTQNIIHQQYEAIFKQNDHFNLIVQGLEQRAAFEEWENRQKDAKFLFKTWKLSKLESCLSFPTKLHYAMFIHINVSWQCLQINTLMSDFRSVYCSIISKMVCTFFMTVCKNYIRISYKILFEKNISPIVNKSL